MTRPVERTISVIAARRFLYDLLNNEGASAEIKRQAQTLLRYFATTHQPVK